MATFRHGRGTRIFVDDYDLTTFFKEAASARTVDTAETSAYGTFDKTYVVGMRDASLSLGGMFDGSANAVDQVLSTILGQEATVPVTYAPEALNVGRRVILLEAEETTHETSSPINDVVAVSAEFQASGGAHTGVSLHDPVAGSASGPEATNVDNGALTSNGALAILHVVANTRNGATADLRVQHSVDGSAWVDLITFASVPSSTIQSEAKSVTGTVNRYLRANWTMGGTTGSMTFLISCARKV